LALLAFLPLPQGKQVQTGLLLGQVSTKLHQQPHFFLAERVAQVLLQTLEAQLPQITVTRHYPQQRLEALFWVLMVTSFSSQFWLAAVAQAEQQAHPLELLVVVAELVVAAVVLAKTVPLVVVVVMAQCLSGLGNERLGR
jgi:hypothetical protein